MPWPTWTPARPLADAGGQPVTANAYLGGWGIAAALDAGADIVICPRVTDASLVTGPAAWWHGWRRDDFDQLAGAVAAGHVIECGPQATGGNYSYLHEITDRRYPGFPVAEIAHDGSSVITKHDGTGGLVSVGTVTAQLLYEIGEPAYLNPDVVAHFDTITPGAAGRAPGAAVRHRRHPAAGHAQGVRQLPRRVPQHDDAGAHRAGHRGEGRLGRPTSCSASSAGATSSTTSTSGCCGSTTPTRRATSRRRRTCGSR